MQFQDEGGLLLPPSIEQKISSTGMSTVTLNRQVIMADVIQGKKYLALKPDAIPENEVALGQMPTLKYVPLPTTNRSII